MQEFMSRLLFEIFGCALFGGVTIVGSYRATAAAKASLKSRSDILAEAAQSQALLETAMPPAIARALLKGAAPESLTQSFESMTIAFVALDEFKTLGGDDSASVLARLNLVYTAFDGLVDAYGDSVNKVMAIFTSFSRADYP